MEDVKIDHNDYKKISDKIMKLSDEYVLKFVTELYYVNKNGQNNYHNEYGYVSDNKYGITINRDFNMYLSIESIKRSEGYKVQIKIGIKEIGILKLKLKKVMEWFTSKQHENLFVVKDGKMTMLGKVPPIISSAMFNSYIEFDAAVGKIPQTEQMCQGVRVFLGSDGISFFMPIMTLITFVDFINSFNMYQSAQSHLNYLGRPANGTNYTDLTGSHSQDARKSTSFLARIHAEKRDK